MNKALLEILENTTEKMNEAAATIRGLRAEVEQLKTGIETGDFETQIVTKLIDSTELKKIHARRGSVESRRDYFTHYINDKKELVLISRWECGCIHDCCGHPFSRRLIIGRTAAAGVYYLTAKTYRNV